MSVRRNGDGMRPQEFLQRIAAFVEPQFYLFLGRKDWAGGTGKFKEYKFKAAALHDGDKITNGKTPDLYFCPNGFLNPKRQRSVAAGKARLLYADLDEVDPYSLEGVLRPQVAWETSPGRFQCMWILDKGLGPRAFERLNKSLTYHIKADKGGWSWTKYLRLPGCVSNKHEEPFRVRVLWASWDDKVPVVDLRRAVGKALDISDPASGAIDLPQAMGPEIARKYWSVLSARGKKLIRAKEVRSGDDRSAKLWDLHMACAEAGMSIGEMIRVAQDCVYNKYKGQRREVRALGTEAHKAMQKIHESRRVKAPSRVPEEDEDEEPSTNGHQELEVPIPQLFEPIWANKLLARSSRAPSWLVDRVWGDGAYGWWAGQEKTYKSTLLMDLAVSVATGLPFLGEFDVPRRGPVLMIQEENRTVAHILHRIASSKALAPHLEEFQEDNPYVHLGKQIRVAFVNQRRFDLTDMDNMRWLELWIRLHNPRLVILDPWYRMTAGSDESDANAVGPILDQIAAISTEYETAIIVAHHFKKPQDGQTHRESHRLSGSGMMGRWWSSAVWSDLTKDGNLKLTFQHREHPDNPPVLVDIQMDEDDPDDYEVTVTDTLPNDESTIDLSKGKKNGVGLGDRNMQEFTKMVVGELMPLPEAIKKAGCSHAALRTRVKKSESFELHRPQKGRPEVVVRVS